MKLTLRNLAMGAAVLATSAVFAQEAPFTVTQNWLKSFSAAELGSNPSTEIRTGTGVNGKVYALDKSKSKLLALDADGVTVVREDLPVGIGTAISADDAGNILFSCGWAGAASVTKMGIAPADGGELILIDPVTYPEGYSAGRSDNWGRVVGNMLDEELGGIVYISNQTAASVIAGIHFVGGAINAETFEYPSDAVKDALDSQSTVVPLFNKIDEQLDQDPIYNAFYATRRGEWMQTPDGEGGTIIAAKPVAADKNTEGLNEGVYYNGFPGGDVINYGDKKYYVYPYTSVFPLGYQANFLISDEEGNILFKTDFDTEFAPSHGYGSGGNYVVRQKDDSTFEIYMYSPEGAANSLAGMWTVSFAGEDPQPNYPEQLYLVGAASAWTTPDADNAEFYELWTLPAVEGQIGVYEGKFTIEAGKAMFRFYGSLNGWDNDTFGAAVDDSAVDVAFTDNVYEGSVVAGKGSWNFGSWTGGEISMTVNLFDRTVKFVAENVQEYVAPELYLRGDFNNWGTTVKMDREGPDADGLYTYTATVPELTLDEAGEFKAAVEDWSVSFGAGENPNIANGVAMESWQNGQNFKAEAGIKNATVKLVVNPDYSVASSMTVTWAPEFEVGTLSALATNVKCEESDGKYTITYNVTAPATAANLVLTSVDDPETVINVAMDAPEVGENTFVYDNAELPEGQYTWAVEIVSNNDSEEPTIATIDSEYLGYDQYGRGGVVCITDPAQDSYGYTVIANNRGQGVNIITPDGKSAGKYTYDVFQTGGNSCPMSGDQRDGKAVFASWGDGSSGLYVIDPLNPETTYNMLDCNGEATRESNGLWTYNGVQTMGGTPCVAFLGKDEETTMWVFEEDLYKNQLVGFPIGTEPYVTMAASVVEATSWSKSALANTQIKMQPTSHGVFCSQTRAAGWPSAVPPFTFSDEKGELVSTCPDNIGVVSCNGGLAVTTDEQVLAIGQYDGVSLYTIEWLDDEGVIYPELTTLVEKVPYPGDAEYQYATFRFDAAGNLYMFCMPTNKVTTGVILRLTLGGENTASTIGAGKISGNNSGVEGIAVDAADAAAVYYNINGVQVPAENLTPGVYVKVVGKTATKVVVK